MDTPTKMVDPEQSTNIVIAAVPADNYKYLVNYQADGPHMVGLPQEAAPPLLAAKVGGKCCGCCCDYRRATFVVDILVLVFNLLAVIILASYGDFYMDENFGEDEEPYNAILAEIIFSLITAIAGGIGIYGCIKYNAFAAGLTGVWLLINWMASLINAIAFCAAYEDTNPNDHFEHECHVNPGSVTFTFIIAACFIYPHVLFIKEMKQGIMTEYNYPREKFSCCCT
mmetsp:Transcript_4622/g.8791  ORF Transcript_4622/g.8791 Transcript_4622/m.8791 type:complete len:226 (+) Transcript_4622:236-913(+)